MAEPTSDPDRESTATQITSDLHAFYTQATADLLRLQADLDVTTKQLDASKASNAVLQSDFAAIRQTQATLTGQLAALQGKYDNHMLIIHGTVVVPGGLVESANDSTITPGVSRIIDAALSVWTITVDGVVQKNGANYAFTSQVILLLYHGGDIYQENSAFNWWVDNGTDWTSVPGDPRVSGTAPSITSSLAAFGTNGAAFSYQIVASNTPTSYSASGLPSGLSINVGTGAITGTPVAAATTNVTIGAANAFGSDSETLQITISAVAPTFISSTHLMLALVDDVTDMAAYMQILKDDGVNTLYLHADAYYAPTNEPAFNAAYQGEPVYPETLDIVADACAAVGIKFMPSLLGNAHFTKYMARQMMVDSFGHSAVFKISTKPVFIIHDYGDAGRISMWQNEVVPFLATYGYARNTYLLFAFPRGQPTSQATYEGWLDGGLDGIIEFAVDFGIYGATPTTNGQIKDRIIAVNAAITAACLSRGKTAIAGTSGIYLPPSANPAHDLVFDNMAAVWQALTDISPASRPQGVSRTTANDLQEGSNENSLYNEQNGMVKWPEINGYPRGIAIRRPHTARSGIPRFTRPWLDALLTGASSPSFTVDRLFCKYLLHPVGVAAISGSDRENIPPALLADLDAFQIPWQTWNETDGNGNFRCPYHRRPDQVADLYAADEITVAAHLTAAAFLRIKLGGVNHDSGGKAAGWASFSVSRGSFLGTPQFAIVRASVEVKTGIGPQAIVNSPYPGGWSPVVTEV